MKKIKLYGDLQAFRADWELEVLTPAEALRAIEANRPGFLQACDQGDYIAILVDLDNHDLTRQVNLDNNTAPWADEVLMILPRAGGDVVAAALIPYLAAFGAYAATVATVLAVVINIGISMAISALANLITGKKQSATAASTENYQSRPSFISNGAVNVVRAGNPYPIIAGNFLCGSIVLSSQIHVKDIPV
jgi:predicted phage tail protein